MPSRDYPATVAEVLDERLTFRRATLRALRRFARAKPWRGTECERVAKFNLLHADLCRVYFPDGEALVPFLRFGNFYPRAHSGASYYLPACREIYLTGRLSVITYLHEFAHALGRGERGACRWSINLFRHCFPRSFSRCAFHGHMVLNTRSN